MAFGTETLNTLRSDYSIKEGSIFSTGVTLTRAM